MKKLLLSLLIVAACYHSKGQNTAPSQQPAPKKTQTNTSPPPATAVKAEKGNGLATKGPGPRAPKGKHYCPKGCGVLLSAGEVHVCLKDN